MLFGHLEKTLSFENIEVPRSLAMENTEGFLVALYRLTQGFDPVVIIWTSTLALALAYFLIAKILEPFWPAPTR